jgi:hypothetical protein
MGWAFDGDFLKETKIFNDKFDAIYHLKNTNFL